MPKEELFDRNEVLDRAIDLFQRKGYNGTSIGDLEEATKLKRSSIYNSFDSKQNMFFEVMKAYSKRYGVLLSKAIQEAKDVPEAILNIFEVHIDVMTKDKTHSGCLFVNSKAELWNEDDFCGFLERSQEGLFKLLFDLIEKGKLENSIRDNVGSKEQTLFLMTNIHGIRLTGMSNYDKKELRQVAEQVVDGLRKI